MKIMNKTALAVSLSLIGAISSMSAIAMSKGELRKEQKIEISVDDSKDVQVFVSHDGDITELEVPKSLLTDKAYLDNALAALPGELREKVVSQLTGIHMDGHVVQLKSGEVNTWVDSGSDKVIILKSIDEENGKSIAKRIVQKFSSGDGKHKIFEFKHGNKVSADSVTRLLKNGDFTPDELDKIQQALDAKR